MLKLGGGREKCYFVLQSCVIFHNFAPSTNTNISNKTKATKPMNIDDAKSQHTQFEMKRNTNPPRLVVFLFFLACAISASAGDAVRKDSIEVWGKVTDFFTGEALEKGMVTVYDENDSILVVDTLFGTGKRYWGTFSYDVPGGYKFKLPRGGEFKIRFDIEGYTADLQDLKIPDRQYRKYTTEWMADFKVRKKPKEHTLGEAQVRATKIKMVVKGDTVEYDADAFNVAEGSMLDKLIEAMPGMELRSNGEIYHNGQKVESLLVNGKDFFSGDPKLALENLPAYTVKKVQVYRKDADQAYLIKDSLRREEMKSLVIDVKLKKEYSQGWTFNADMAYGTRGRYKASGSALFFSDNWKFLGYASLNNLNQDGGVSDDGSLYSWDAASGLHHKKKGGLILMYDKDDKFKNRAGFEVSHTNDNEKNEVSTTTFLTDGDTYSRSRTSSLNSSTYVSFYDNIQLSLRNMHLYFLPIYVTHTQSKGRGQSMSATFDDDPKDSYRLASLDSLYLPMGSQRLEAMRLNDVLDVTQSKTHSTSLQTRGDMWTLSPIFGNNLQLSYSLDYSANESKNSQHYPLDNKQTSTTEHQNIYTLTPSYSLSGSAAAGYDLPLGPVGLTLNYSYQYQREKNNPERYRLDSLAGWDDFDQHLLGQLPSTRDSMLVAMDLNNSNHRTQTTHTHSPTIDGHIGLGNNWYATATLPLNIKRESITDSRYQNGQHVSQNLVSLDPTVGLRRYHNNKQGMVVNYSIDYHHSTTMPSIS